LEWVLVGSSTLGAPNDMIGFSVDINTIGNRLVYGAHGADYVKILEYDGSNWNQIGNTITGEANSLFGYEVRINDNGTRVAISSIKRKIGGYAPGVTDFDGQGAVEIYSFDPGSNIWSQYGNTIYGIQSYGQTGKEIHFNSVGDIFAECANGVDINPGVLENTGVIRVRQFNTSTGTWMPKGTDINGSVNGEALGDNFLYINDVGTLLIAGSSIEEHYKIYDFDGLDWNLRTTIKASDLGVTPSTVFGMYGEAKESNGDLYLATSAYMEATGLGNLGIVRVYKITNSTVVQVGGDILPVDATINGFGTGMSFNGDCSRLAIGGAFSNGTGGAEVHEFIGGSWVRLANAVYGTANANLAAFGGISLNEIGDVFVIGASESFAGDKGGEVSTFILSSSLPWNK
jgi:hypothetical protein